jgi:hypothetical protein
VTLLQVRPHRTLCRPRGAEIATVEAVKGAIRGEEAEAASIADNDAGGSI